MSDRPAGSTPVHGGACVGNAVLTHSHRASAAHLKYVESDKRGYGKRLEIADSCVAIMRLFVNRVCLRAADLQRELMLA